jgi:hypothetical protein
MDRHAAWFLTMKNVLAKTFKQTITTTRMTNANVQIGGSKAKYPVKEMVWGAVSNRGIF